MEERGEIGMNGVEGRKWSSRGVRIVNSDAKGLRAFAPFVHEHSLLSTIHKFFKMELKVFADFLNKSGVSCHYVCLQCKFRF